MEYLVDPDIVKQEEFQTLETGLSLEKDHLTWLYHLNNSIPHNPSDLVHFCISCSRYLMLQEDPVLHRHQDGRGPHHLVPVIRVQRSNLGTMGGINYYVSVDALSVIQSPTGDVVSHALPHPHRHGVNAGQKVSCLYLHPPTEAKWQGGISSGKCAFRECERVFPNRQAHLRLYEITPQFCSISCKLKTWFCLNK